MKALGLHFLMVSITQNDQTDTLFPFTGSYCQVPMARWKGSMTGTESQNTHNDKKIVKKINEWAFKLSWIAPWGMNKVFWLDLTWLDLITVSDDRGDVRSTAEHQHQNDQVGIDVKQNCETTPTSCRPSHQLGDWRESSYHLLIYLLTYLLTDRHGGLVVKASASWAGGSGFDPWPCHT